MLPLEQGERITSIMPLPEDEDSWGELDVMFATTRGTVRRNKLSDFVQVNRNGKIAMKLEDEGDEILAVYTCTEDDDVVLSTALGQCIRFPVTDVRVFAGRNSIGVRGISMAKNDTIISMCILGHVDAEAAERTAYLKAAAAARRAASGEDEEVEVVTEETGEAEATELTSERFEELQAREEFLLTISAYGIGKRSSSYDFRISGRGGKGIRATDVTKLDTIGELVAAFPVEPGDQIMLVTDKGKLIRVPVEGIRIASRATRGVTIFSTGEGERVVSVERITEPEGEEDEELPADGAAEASGAEDGPEEGPEPQDS